MSDDKLAAVRLLLPTTIDAVGRAGPVFSLSTDKLKLGVWCAWRLEKGGQYTCGSDDESSWPEIDKLARKRLVALIANANHLDLRLDFDDGTVLFVFCNTAKDPWHIDAPGAGYLMPLP